MKRYLTHLVALCVLMISAESFAKKNEFLYKGATVAPPNTPWSALLKKYKKDVRKASSKRIKAKV